jgi:putative solute:sodium symporter small subunit
MKKDRINEINSRYWKSNLKVVIPLLIIWALLGFVFSIVLVEPLNGIRFAGFKLGFWIAQQGAMIGFIFIILAYAVIMNRIDRKFEDEVRQAQSSSADSDQDNRQNGLQNGGQDE